GHRPVPTGHRPGAALHLDHGAGLLLPDQPLHDLDHLRHRPQHPRGARTAARGEPGPHPPLRPQGARPAHLTTGILLRSMVIQTAAIRTRPSTICWANTLTPMKVMPTRTTETIRAPIAVRQTLPTPPVSAVPPTITAAI